MVKNLPATQETWVLSLSQEDPLEKGMATHSSILAWRIPWTEQHGGLHTYSPWAHKETDVAKRPTLSHISSINSHDPQIQTLLGPG